MVKSNSRQKSPVPPICKVGDRISSSDKNFWGTCISNNYTSIMPYKILWDNGHEGIYKRSQIEDYGYLVHPCLPSKTTAQVSVSGSHLQQLSLENLPLQDSAKLTNTAVISSPLDSPVSQSKEISKPWTANGKKSKSSQLPPRVNRSQFKVKGSEPTTIATVSQHSSLKSRQLNLDFSVSKTSEDSSAAPTSQDLKSDILLESSTSFPAAGTMSNGKWREVASISVPSLEKDYYWLDSPGALSSGNSRVPGQSKLEASLKQTGHLQNGECINPVFLENAFTIPEGWSDPLESRTAIALLEEDAKLLETVSTPELQQLPSVEFSTSTASAIEWKIGDRVQVTNPSTPESITKHGWIVDGFTSHESLRGRLELIIIKRFTDDGSFETRTFEAKWLSRLEPDLREKSSKQTGSIYQYTANKADKLLNIHTYPKVEGERKREEDSHWYWGFSYVEKERGKWRDKSAAIPKSKVSAVRAALRDGKPYTYILEKILGKL